MPMVLDQLDNRVGEAYAGWPDRFYIVGTDGRIAYQGGPGPWGFDSEAMEARLRQILKRDRPAGDQK